MTINSLAYILTSLLGAVFLGTLLWAYTFNDGYSEVLAILLLLCFLASVVANITLAALQRSRASVYRILINAAVCLLFFPTIHLGTSLRDRLFLSRLPRFQKLTDLLIKQETAKANGAFFRTDVNFPPGYSNLDVMDIADITSASQNVTVRFLLRNSTAVGHGGYMYRSDDDPAALSKEFPHIGSTRIAPHWFFFFD